MNKTLDIKVFEELMASDNKNALETAMFWNAKADQFNEYAQKEDESKKALIQSYADKGIINKDSVVLDLGCGAGGWSMIIAPYVKQVIGVDISDKMIEYAKENTKSFGNCQFKNINWWDCDIDEHGFRNKFDLVFANMTPSINNADALYKMIASSKGYCHYATFVYRKSDINEKLGRNFTRDIFAVFNLLWMKQMYATVEYGGWQDTNEYNIKEKAEMLIKDYGFEDEKELREKLAEFIKGDTLFENSEHKTARLLWQVK